jgi:alkanesulfonate monooxygenase SsuD/methylene tetrahydromethanopterin reductase-like flavin-dependent oxidoreductase (luciferase family)
VTRLRSALWLPLFDDLADPWVVARVAADAEAAGWDGVFVWDQLCWPAPVCNVADPWLTLAMIAVATEHVRFGPMVTPPPRRRPAKLARETATLDRLGNGRLTVGVGIGSDQSARELSRTGEQIDDRIRGEMLDEALEILTSAWSGEPVRHRGRHYTVDGIQFLPQPAQRSDIPVWAADFPGNVKPIRRAARLDGVFPANLNHPDQLAEVVATITELRKQDTTAYDFAVGLPVGVDPLPYASAGATWWLPEFEPGVALDTVQGVLRDGPARWTE